MKRLMSALLVLAAAGCGGVDVQGIVRDERTGEPLPGATVRIGEEEATTDYRGFYELSVDPEEARQLSVDKAGYREFSEDVTFEDVEEVIQDIDLAPQNMQQHQGFEGGIQDDPMLHDQDMQRQGGLNEDRSLQRDPNLQQGQQGGGVQQRPQGGSTQGQGGQGNLNQGSGTQGGQGGR